MTNVESKAPGDLAREARLRLGLSQTELATRASVMEFAVESLENGMLHMLGRSALRIWKILDIKWVA